MGVGSALSLTRTGRRTEIDEVTKPRLVLRVRAVRRRGARQRLLLQVR